LVKCEIVKEVHCFIKHLKDINAFNSSIEVEETSWPQEFCKKVVTSFSKEFKKDIIAQLDPNDNKNCIIALFNEYNIASIYLKGFVYSALNVTRVLNFEQESKETTSDVIHAARTICTARQRYGKVFNESLENKDALGLHDSSTQECIKKYYFDKKIILPEDFGIDVATIKEKDCEEIYKELGDSALNSPDVVASSTFYGLPSSQAQECSNKKFVEGNILLKISSFDIAIRFDLNEDQRLKLLDDYIVTMTSNIRFLLECLQKLL
jgi:hypothetical protein